LSHKINNSFVLVMGKTKLYTETETNAGSTQYQKTGATAMGTSKSRKNQAMPERYGHVPSPELPTSILVKQILIRLKRNWVALRFQFNRYTFGAFVENNRLKAVILGGAFYAAMRMQGPDIGPYTGADIMDNEPEAVALDVGQRTSQPRTKTTQWGTKNEAAPVSSKYMNAEMVNDYVRQYSNIAITEMQKFGVPASISLAQGLIESRAGTSKLAKRNQNHFGIKCFSRHCKKGHCSNFTDDSHKDFFRAFKNPWESWREHSRMISTGRYAKLKNYGRDYRKWAYGLKSVGYATDRTYAEKLIGIIEEYELYKYDR
jgi:flagellum-specific peptidoglycan hydrolase FlgJ